MEDATGMPEASTIPCVSFERRHLVLRCRTRTVHIIWAAIFACMALAAAMVYQRPALQVKAYTTFKHAVLGYGVAERFGVGDPSKEMVLNRKGLQVPKDDLAGRKPVSMPMTPEVLLDYIGESFFRLFRSVDSDGDDYLNPAEFARLMERIQPIKTYHSPSTHLPVIASGDERTVELHCVFDPLHLDTITKDLSEAGGTNLHYLSDLLNWTKPARCPFTLPESLLIDGLRPPLGQPVGVPYYITKRPEDPRQSALWIRDEFDYETDHSVNRYAPPDYTRPGARLLRALLSGFHPGAFASTRHPPHSSVALVRALGPDHVDVAFRVHGEFQLASPPAYPFWFTPSFWFGHAVFSADFTRLISFDMDLPVDKKLNVDMEWVQTGLGGAPDEQMVEVDIGHSSAMRICTPDVKDKRPTVFGQYEHQMPKQSQQQLQESLSFDRAFAQLEVELYPFKRVPYLAFPEAFRQVREAKTNNSESHRRLVHSVVLWGSLDDQSC